MAEILCPNCGRSNPEDLEHCANCGTALAAASPESQGDDWLSSLRAGDDIYREEEDQVEWPAEGDESPEADRLERIASGPLAESRSDPASLPENPPDATAAPDQPDWLKDLLRATSDPAAEPGAEPGEAALPEPEDFPDWLAELKPPDMSAEAPDDDEEPLPADETPDWLSGLESPKMSWEEPDTGEGEPLPAEESPGRPAEFEPPEMGEEAPDETGDAPVPPEEGIPDWLAELQPPEAFEDVAEEEPDADEPEALPDWLTALGSPEEIDEFEPLEPPVYDDLDQPEAPEGAVEAGEPEEDWLAGFIDEPGEAQTAAEREATPHPGEPDWLSGFEDEIRLSALPEEALADDDLPGRPDAPGEPPREPAPSEPDDDAPPWLSEFETESEGEAAGRPGARGREFEDDYFEEPGDFAEAEPLEEPDEMFDLEQEPEPAEEVPDWLVSALGQVEAGPEEALEDDLAIDPAAFEPSAPVEPSAEGDADADLQEWLSKYDRDAGDAPEPEPEPEDEAPEWLKEVNRLERRDAEPAEEEGIPDWLRELNEQTPGFEMEAEAAGAEAPDEETDAVDWMPESTAFEMLSEVEGIEEDLAPGELPEWLRSMRPIDATAPGVMETGESDTGSVERIGPLAGLRGVLSAEPTAALSGRPPSHSVRLQVTDSQQTRANQLQKMVAGETEPRPAARRAILSEQRVLRYLIAGLLFLTTVLAGVLPGRMSELPAKPPEMDAVTPLITGLTPEAAVLVVLDYQPGMSGELDAAAAGILDHVMIQGARLALVSTSPTGPALGERLVRHVAAEHGYTPGSQYVNLGYVPGSATGLQLLANAPAAAVPVGYDVRPFWALVDPGAGPWAAPALQGVSTLGDFRMTLLLSDDPETVRRWVEQAGPFLQPGTLVVVASAQAEPMVRPYLESGQIAALVSGLGGGAAYEGFLQREGPARAAWDGVGVGTLAAVVLVLGAGTYNLYLVWEERERLRKGGS